MSPVDVRSVIVSREINVNVAGELRVLITNHRRTRTQLDLGDLAKRNLSSTWRHQEDIPERVEIITVVLQITDVDRIALAPLNRGGDVFAAYAGRDR